MADDDAPDEGGTTTEPQDQNGDQDEPRDKRTDTGRRDEPAKDSGQDKQDGRTFTQADVDRIIADRVARAEKKYADYSDLKKKAAKLAEIEDAQKSEVEKLNDQLTEAQVELQAFRVAETRRKAASEAGLDPELAEYITSADPDEALAQAKKLADRLAPKEPKTPDFRQGSRPPARQAETRDQLIRRMTGHST